MIETEDCLQRLTERTFYGVSDCAELVGPTLRWCGIIARSSGF